MAKVFLSYDRDDTERARPVALALEKAGHFVWWDLHIRGGEQFSKVIDEALKAADAVVVLWSKYSIESPWVRDEAAAGRDSGRLIPVSLDDTQPPLGFRQYQTIDLSGWKGRGRPAQLQSLFADVEATARSSSLASDLGSPAPVSPTAPSRRYLSPKLIAVAALLLVLAAGFVGWKLLRPASSVPSVAIEATGQTPAAQALARDLFVKLGSLQASNSEAIQLLDSKSDSRPTLVFEVGGDVEATQPHANLVLLNGGNRSLYWSKEFTAPAGGAGDLRQQLGYTAALIIGCVTEGLNKKGKPLRQDTLKLYLNACAAYADSGSSNPDLTLSMFRQITQQAPDFPGGWGGLLLTETEALRRVGNEPIRAQVLRDIAAARRVDPNMGEALVAEIDLAPPDAYSQRVHLANRAVELEPRKPLGYAARSGVMMGIGRMGDAVADAAKAVELDPLSPILRDFYIQALLYAGRMEAVQQELEQAERLWPGTSMIKGLRFRINLRYGDAREALKVLGTGDLSNNWLGAESYLEARIDPSPAKVDRAIQYTAKIYQRSPENLGHVAQVWAEFGKEQQLIALLLTAPRRELSLNMETLFRPTFKRFWQDPRALQIANRSGMLKYWQSSGLWPDFCNRADLPYDCKKEAAKLNA